jgi:hypothetical protein
MWVRVLQADAPDRCHFGAPVLESGEELALRLFASGTRLEIQRVRLPIVRSGKINALGMVMDVIPVVTTPAADVLSDRLESNIQLIPCCEIDGQALWVVNILTMLDCLNRSLSHAEYYPATYPLPHLASCVKSAMELVIEPSIVASYQMFRIKGDELKLVASTDILDFLDASGLRGLGPGQMPRYRVAQNPTQNNFPG